MLDSVLVEDGTSGYTVKGVILNIAEKLFKFVNRVVA